MGDYDPGPHPLVENRELLEQIEDLLGHAWTETEPYQTLPLCHVSVDVTTISRSL